MNFRRVVYLALALATPLALFSTSQSQTQKKPTTTAKPAANTVIFAVNKYEGGNTSIDPVVMLSGGRFINPMAKDDEASLKAFTTKYLRVGQKYRLLFGGAENGSVTVKERYTECICLTAGAEAQTTAKLGGEVRALATTSSTLGAKQSSRRAPTPEERAAVMNLAKQAFKQNKVPAGFLANITTHNLTATDLDGDGKAELIGSFQVNGYKDAPHALLLIVEPQANDFKIGLSWFAQNNDEEMRESRRYIDQLDIDGDGVGEVFVESGYYESTDFTIYKKVKGVWRSVYKGGLYGI
ncbi:MAG: hypothetical protein AB1757_22940 [Acidobacteriota bacterium]